MRKRILSGWIGLLWIATLVWGETSVPIMSSDEVERGRAAAERYGFDFAGISEPAVEDLSPKLLLYSRWSAGDVGEAPGE